MAMPFPRLGKEYNVMIMTMTSHLLEKIMAIASPSGNIKLCLEQKEVVAEDIRTISSFRRGATSSVRKGGDGYHDHIKPPF